MAPRSVWKGTVGFGMVSIPVKLYGVVEEKAIRFNSLHRECNTRIQMPRWCPSCDVKVESDDLVKGFPVTDEKFVLMEESDFASLPVKSLKAIEIMEFVGASHVDPRHYSKPYYMAPDVAGGKAFALLLHGMNRVGSVAVAKLSMRDREHLCTIRPCGDVLLVQTLHWADELRDAAGVSVDLPEISDQELDLAVGLIEALAGSTSLSSHKDEYREALTALIEAKNNGEVIQAAPVEEAPATEDVVAGLLASIEAAKAANVPVTV